MDLQWGAMSDLHRPPQAPFILTQQRCAHGVTVAGAVAWTTDRQITGLEKGERERDGDTKRGWVGVGVWISGLQSWSCWFFHFGWLMKGCFRPGTQGECN